MAGFHKISARSILFWGSIAFAILATWTLLIWMFSTSHRYYMVSGGMKPNLLVGDMVNAASFDTVVRGDVLVFTHPAQNTDFIFRVMGLPGDQIQMVAGEVVLNGQALRYAPADDFVAVFERQGPNGVIPACRTAVGLGADCVKSALIETLPSGRSYAILNIMDDGRLDNTKLFTVPDGHYFFLGDNRDNSADSRLSRHVGGMGFVPHENLQYRLRRVVLSFMGQSKWEFWTWRSDRYFKDVQ
ncbi:MAG: signal peptidase I [Planktomarina sp.]